VFWSHGLGGVAGLYTTFAADLASHGFLVVAIDHTYGAFASVFPDGSIKSIKTGTNSPPFPMVVEIWARDMASVLDRLTELNASDPSGLLTGRLDLDRVGATGHSTGGSAAAEILTLDDRFLAAVTLDAPQVGRAAEGEGVDKPLEIFFANPSDYLSTAVEDHLQAPGLSLTLDGTTHNTFTDLPILLELADVPLEKRLASVRPMGSIDPYRNLQVINDWTLAFFDNHLRQGGPAVLNQALYPELSVRRIGFVARSSR
jgi:dienelactone hydrolase